MQCYCYDLYSTMSQDRLSNLIILHVLWYLTGKLYMQEVANEFVYYRNEYCICLWYLCIDLPDVNAV